MNFKRILAALMCMIITLSCCNFVFAATPVIKVNINIGQGEKKDVSTYMKSDTGLVSWSGGNTAIATVSGKEIKGVKVGTTMLTGTTKIAKYEFTVKVLANYSTLGTIKNEPVSTTIKNSKGEVINYQDYYLTMGPNDKLDVSAYLGNNVKYFNYSWGISNEKLLDFKQGKLIAKTEGIVRVNAKPRTSNIGNTIKRFYVTIDSNYLSKNFTVGRNTLTPLSNYLGEEPVNYILNCYGVNGAAAYISGNYIAAGNGVGTSILTAESTTGGTNYCFIIKSR